MSNNGKIRVPTGHKLHCEMCKRTNMLQIWPLRGHGIGSGVVSMIGVLCPACRGLAAVGSSTAGFNKGWDNLAVKLRDKGFILTGMCGLYQRQSKKAKVWRFVKNSYGQEGARGRGQHQEVK